MAFVPVPGGIRAVINYTFFGESVSNVLNFEDLSSPGSPRVALASGELLVSWVANIMPLLSLDIVLNSVQSYDLNSATAPVALSSSSPGTTGGVAVEAEYVFASARIKMTTGLRGPSFRGRIFVPGVPVSEVGNGLLGSNFRSDLNTAFGQVRADMSAQDFQLSVLSTVSGGVPRPTGVLTPVTVTGVPEVPSALNRRQQG